MKRGIIFGASEYFGGYAYENGDFIIAADGGLATLERISVKPDVIIGDFDSGEKPSGEAYILLPKEKDDTDMLAAIKIALKEKCGEIHIYGGSGGEREEHTMANIQCLSYLASIGIKPYLYCRNQTVTALCSGEIRFPARESGYISIFSHTDKCEGVTVKGLKYCLDGAELTNSFPLGISNEFIGEEAVIGVKDGILIIYY